MAEESRHEQDELRPCPTCRMPISIFATRCRYCGEAVGRPRKEQEKLTVEDLGGTQKTTYTISSDVMDALDAFRAEVLAEQEAHRREKEASSQSTWFGHRAGASETDNEIRSDSGLPELDEEHKSLASIVSETTPKAYAQTPRPKARRSGDWQRWILMGAGAAAALLVIFFAGGPLVDKIRQMIEKSNQTEEIVYENNALKMLEAGKPPLEALREAQEALKFNNTPENQAIAKQVRAKLAEKVNTLINCDPWDSDKINEASRIISQAILLDSDTSIQQLVQRVNEDVAAYKMILTSIDKDAGSATFKLHNPNFPEKEQVVGIGDYVEDRFLVKLILNTQVQLEDTKVRTPAGNRRLIARPLTQLEAG